jgi:hypothetical protein
MPITLEEVASALFNHALRINQLEQENKTLREENERLTASTTTAGAKLRVAQAAESTK